VTPKVADDAGTHIGRGVAMSDHTYGVSEVVGTSALSIDDAIRGAVDRANQTVRHLDWFEVVGVRGHLKDGQVAHYQVTIKLGFRLDPASDDHGPT
jgi:flavin-binding protein dodecin